MTTTAQFSGSTHGEDTIPLVSYLTLAPIQSDGLLAIIIVTAGGIGALIAGLRTREFTSFRDLALGFATGFIAYLGIRGGKYIFLIEHAQNGVDLTMNPFGCALSGLLAGLFTDRAYELITALVDTLIKKIKTAMA